MTLLAAHVEIAVSKSLAIQTCLYPIMIHAECAQEDTTIVATQDAVVSPHAFSLKVEEDRIDQLHHIVTFHLGKYSL